LTVKPEWIVTPPVERPVLVMPLAAPPPQAVIRHADDLGRCHRVSVFAIVRNVTS
jgi:hypothetical protein